MMGSLLLGSLTAADFPGRITQMFELGLSLGCASLGWKALAFVLLLAFDTVPCSHSSHQDGLVNGRMGCDE